MRPKEFLNLIHPDFQKVVNEQSVKKQAGEKEILMQYQIKGITKSGKIIWIENYSRSINYEGRPANLAIMIDITEKKKAEEELINLNKLKSELLTRTSHELKTPLVSIKGYSDLLLELYKDKFNDMALSSIRQIKRGCEKLEKTVNNILNTAYLESDHVKLNLTVENLSFLIKFVINDLKGLALTRNHEIIIDILDNMVLKIEKERIYDVLSNLIINAIKYERYGFITYKF